eukprot:SM007899S22523  [mRNA]  locus=s7899:21:634:- [translate_table: standard]
MGGGGAAAAAASVVAGGGGSWHLLAALTASPWRGQSQPFTLWLPTQLTRQTEGWPLAGSGSLATVVASLAAAPPSCSRRQRPPAFPAGVSPSCSLLPSASCSLRPYTLLSRIPIFLQASRGASFHPFPDISGSGLGSLDHLDHQHLPGGGWRMRCWRTRGL